MSRRGSGGEEGQWRRGAERRGGAVEGGEGRCIGEWEGESGGR